jgi:transcriptional regulator with XRE-family HTH domain
MPKGVPYRVQVGARIYTFTEVAFGSGLSLSLISLVLRGKRPVSAYAQARLAEFFGITIEQLWTPGTITVQLPPVRPLGRVIRIRRGSSGPPVLDRYAASQTVGPQESEEEWDNWLRARLPGGT